MFAGTSATYLGHIISRDGIQPDSTKITAVRDFPIPTTVKGVRQFLGLASYYRRFVSNFSKIVSPLHALTKQNIPFQWTSTCQAAFEQLKSHLVSLPVLVYPNFDLPFALHTDTSKEGLGAVLEQDVSSTPHPIAYASRTLSKPETNYGATELEALGVVWSLCHFRALLGHKCIVYTDHAPLKSSLATKHTSSHRARWNEMMADYDMEIRYKPGTKNANADALSRAPVATSTMVNNTVSAISGSSALLPVDNSDSNTLSSQQKANPNSRKSLRLSPIIRMYRLQQNYLKPLI